METDWWKKLNENIFSQENIITFLEEIKNLIKNKEIKDIHNIKNDRNWRIKIKKILETNFWIKKIKKDYFEELLLEIMEDINNFKFFENEKILDYDISKIENILQKLERYQIAEKVILLRTENKIKNKIENALNDEVNIEDEKVKEILSDLKKYFTKDQIKNAEFKQIFIQESWEHHLILPLVIKIWDKTLNIDLHKNKETWKIVKHGITPAHQTNLGSSHYDSTIAIRKLYDNPDAWFELNPEYKVDYSKFNLENDEEELNTEWKTKVNFDKNLREKIKDGEKKEELNIFIQATKNWNKVFRKNKEELEKAWNNKEKRKKIIEKNAQEIADLFADNASLQGTMNFDNSHWDSIKEYFIHFLEGSPTMRFSRINDITRFEDSLLYVQWDYVFEVDWENWNRIKKDANFEFTFEKNKGTEKWWIKRLNSTFWKTENNFDDFDEIDNEKNS